MKTYTTTFEGFENPLSEGGNWSNNGLVWTNIRKDGGLAYSTQSGLENGAARYADSYAVISGFPPDQEAWGEAYIAKPSLSYNQELEILLRWTSTPNCTTGYECMAKCVSNDASYVQIVRWNGRLGDFTYLADMRGADFGLKSGDILKASIIGNVITVYVNGIQKARAVDDTYKTGNPGVGMYLHCNDGQGIGTNRDFGFTRFFAGEIEENSL